MILLAWGVDLRPYFFIFGLPVIALTGWIARRFLSPWVTWRAVISAVGAVYILVFWFFFYGPFVDVERRLTFPMTWEIKAPGYAGTTQAHVVLTFRDFPDYEVGIISDEVANYLKHLEANSVQVTFSVTTDWGRTRGFHEERIGELKTWTTQGGYTAVSGNGCSPFP